MEFRGESMNARIQSEGGRTWIEVSYDASTLTWREVVNAATAAYGIRPDQLVVVALRPVKTSTASKNSCQVGNTVGIVCV